MPGKRFCASRCSALPFTPAPTTTILWKGLLLFVLRLQEHFLAGEAGASAAKVVRRTAPQQRTGQTGGSPSAGAMEATPARPRSRFSQQQQKRQQQAQQNQQPEAQDQAASEGHGARLLMSCTALPSPLTLRPAAAPLSPAKQPLLRSFGAIKLWRGQWMPPKVGQLASAGMGFPSRLGDSAAVPTRPPACLPPAFVHHQHRRCRSASVAVEQLPWDQAPSRASPPYRTGETCQCSWGGGGTWPTHPAPPSLAQPSAPPAPTLSPPFPFFLRSLAGQPRRCPRSSLAAC